MIKQKGFTLIEMMIALTLSSILMLGLFQIFNSNKQAYSTQGGIARMQESGRIALEMLSREMRSAGYMGCSTGGFGESFTNQVDTSAGKIDDSQLNEAIQLLDGDSGIVGFDDVTSITAGSTLDGFGLSVGTGNGEVISGTDVIIMQGVEPCDGGKVLVGGTGTAQLKIEDASACGLEQNDIVIVSNCKEAEAFGITNNPTSAGSKDTLAHGSDINITNKLTGTYDDDSFIYNFNSTLFYVGNGVSGEPALFMKGILDANAGSSNAFGSFEIAEGVENLQILYGEDTDGDSSVNRYVEADEGGLDMNAVVAIRTRLLMRSQDRITQTNQEVTFNGNTFTAADNRMRVTYETTSAIRNRVN